MKTGRLSPFQVRLLRLLVDADQGWTLAGGIEHATTADIGGTAIPIATQHELLVDKLCTLLERSELRHLVDVRQLLIAGCDLERAVLDAPKKDGGFSPLTLAWTLRTLDISRLAAATGWDPGSVHDLELFRTSLVEQLLALSDPRR